MPSNNKQLLDKYIALGHAIQSAVAYKMGLGLLKETEPKHLRVGVNMAMVDTNAIISLLIDKGIISEFELYNALVAAAQKELDKYEDELGMPRGTFK